VREVPDATLSLVGTPSPDYDVAADVRRLGLSESVAIREGLSDAQVHELMATARFFVTASREEGYGLAVQEALARRIPCVTFSIPAFESAFPFGRHVAASFDARALARALEDMYRDDVLNDVAVSAQRYRFSTWDDVAADIWHRCVAA
jgi:glycosyltransferase involved in cell wall biosynthesis